MALQFLNDLTEPFVLYALGNQHRLQRAGIIGKRIGENSHGDTSGSNLTFESEEGFPADSSRASLAHANRNFHHSQAQ